jgi:hypothetical protein
LSAVAAFELVYERIGWSPKSRTAYVAIDSGDRQPKGDEITVLGAEFGWPPDPEIVEVSVPPDQTALVAALQAQTKAINALVERMDTFVGPLGDVVADLLRDRIRVATDRTQSGAPTS